MLHGPLIHYRRLQLPIQTPCPKRANRTGPASYEQLQAHRGKASQRGGCGRAGSADRVLAWLAQCSYGTGGSAIGTA